jgi:hypothetical protein
MIIQTGYISSKDNIILSPCSLDLILKLKIEVGNKPINYFNFTPRFEDFHNLMNRDTDDLVT